MSYDAQQQELYTSERKVNWSEYGANERLLDLEDVWVYVNRLISRESFAKRYPITHRRLATGRKTKPARYGSGHNLHVRSRDGKGITIIPRSSGGMANENYMALSKYARQK